MHAGMNASCSDLAGSTRAARRKPSCKEPGGHDSEFNCARRWRSMRKPDLVNESIPS